MVDPGEFPAQHEAGGHSPGGFAGLAKRISSWTTRAVLSAIVVLAGLTFGRQVLRWWGEDSADGRAPARSGPAPDDLANPASPHGFEFGDGRWTITRQEVRGSREEVLGLLRATCREAAQAAPDPGTTAEEPAGPAEIGLLKSLAGRTPVEQEPGQWQLYQLDEPIPLVAAARVGHIKPPEMTNASGGGPVAQPALRVVAWGLALPMGDRDWVALGFRPRGLPLRPEGPLAEVPLPPGSRKTLSVQAAGGGSVVSFQGDAGLEAWTTYYDTWSQQAGWTAARGWEQVGTTWRRRFARTTGGVAATLDVLLGPGQPPQVKGLAIVTPAAPATRGTTTETIGP